MYKITLADGTEINNLQLNGNNFISTESIAKEIFHNNCSPTVINNGENDEVHDNMELVQVIEVNGKHWFVLRDISTEELEKMKVKADIDYIAMMSGIEL